MFPLQILASQFKSAELDVIFELDKLVGCCPKQKHDKLLIINNVIISFILYLINSANIQKLSWYISSIL